jgi:hypothetical protein
MLRELGAEIDTRTGARVGVSLNGQAGVFHHTDHSLTKEEVVRLRNFLTECGIDPAKYPV